MCIHDFIFVNNVYSPNALHSDKNVSYIWGAVCQVDKFVRNNIIL